MFLGYLRRYKIPDTYVDVVRDGNVVRLRELYGNEPVLENFETIIDFWQHKLERINTLEELIHLSIVYNQLECLKYLLDNGRNYNFHVCCMAAEHGQLNILKYLHKNGYEWDENVCSHAAQTGKLECLEYAHENGCPWNEDTCISAAWGGHLECLRYAHERGCCLDDAVWEHAVRQGHFDIFKYALKNGCGLNNYRVCEEAIKLRHFDMFKYAVGRRKLLTVNTQISRYSLRNISIHLD